MMTAAEADMGVPATPKDDSSIATPRSVVDEGTSILSIDSIKRDDGTSVLDMGAVKREIDPSADVGSSALMNAVKRDNTSILGIGWIRVAEGAPERMPYVIADHGEPTSPAAGDTPMPMVLPSTRRSTIQAHCINHQDTPAVVLCQRCGDPVCTMCVTDEAQGGRCTPFCRR